MLSSTRFSSRSGISHYETCKSTCLPPYSLYASGLWHTTKWGDGGLGWGWGGFDTRNPVFPQMLFWPQRSGNRGGGLWGHVPSRREHSMVENRKGNQAFFPPLGWPFAPLRLSLPGPRLGPALISPRPSLLRLQLTNTQAPGKDSGLALDTPPSQRISTSHLIVTALCFSFSSFIFYLTLLPGAPSHPDSRSKRSLTPPVVSSQTVRLSRLFLSDTSFSYLTKVLLHLLGGLSLCTEQKLVHIIRAGYWDFKKPHIHF